eukprot:TRINITY_DN72857_c0_g1_i1.p1 TRINITY_DN72857_c0_g1~~TRINITY_DN72857_c0_g1_i1.p1  ORF type:complete len:792 (+),score=104.98 TRINITY_DN72857_c0_g1_i1:168-2543(+)
MPPLSHVISNCTGHARESLKDGSALDWITLRYSACSEEANFVLRAKTNLLKVWPMVMSLYTVVFAVWCAEPFLRFGPFWRLDDGQLYVEIILLFVRSICIAQALMHVCACTFSGFRARLKYRWFEKRIVVLILSTELATLDRYYIAKILGYADPHALYGEGVLSLPYSESFILLQLCTLLSISHTYVPIRWCAMVVVQLSLLLFHGGCLWLNADSSWKPQLAVLFLVLVFFTSLGKRQTEANERLLFSSLQTEKTLRLKAEFDLLDSRTQSKNDDTVSVADSTCTGEAFACLDDGKGTLPSMQALIHVGKREQWLLSDSELTLDPNACLGCGGFGMVFAGTFHASPVAVKIDKSFGVDADFFSISNELRILRRLRHPNILLFHGACLSVAHNDMVLVTEKVIGDPLLSYMRCQPIDVHRCQIIRGICLGLMYLHTRQPVVSHGDLKPSNVMIERRGENCHAKLLDFGLARLVKQGARLRGGSYRWLAPEMLQERSPSTQGDVYALGLVVFFVCTAELPFKHVSEKALKARARRREATPLAVEWPAQTSRLSKRCKQLVELATSDAPEQRPSAKDIHAKMVWLHHQPMDEDRQAAPACDQLWEMVALARQLMLVKTRSDRHAHADQWATSLAFLGRMTSSNRRRRKQSSSDEDTSAGTRGEAAAAKASSSDAAPGSAPSRELNGAVLLHANHLATPKVSMKASLLSTIASWNFEVPAGSCCELHAATDLLVEFQQLLHRGPCNRMCTLSSCAKPVEQCPACSLMQPGMSNESIGDELCCRTCAYRGSRRTSL